ncbi:Serine/threonine-protein kinase [Komagataella phaffii CBS 7435]|uniref:non-specific serine/threonine protein kinase n=2 Tax=Komagataella phaffii TaxID=460519 RepID=C4R6S7_KOMPG|nr:One of two (see also PSK1) PAS domain containing S/T protein kinases [Komagataella phaffii GS115]AOA65267.1 GQ67_04383T0 [Komagataella phaffii]CAH2451354.1 Serine/threonine-protein kinase [Komagataella phaffii CBS 7435]AOA70288.1 GQ68_04355T0 [Komagataella phaffii GS115]CAY71302.1 One of two (see also PSK1) PAS domain containing S/T protein kinases [Komagataella phaffii GS115]CCA41092.1 Serine/threonine-protein kinase [Komagataella phaffii CBS 7435]
MPYTPPQRSAAKHSANPRSSPISSIILGSQPSSSTSSRNSNQSSESLLDAHLGATLSGPQPMPHPMVQSTSSFFIFDSDSDADEDEASSIGDVSNTNENENRTQIPKTNSRHTPSPPRKAANGMSLLQKSRSANSSTLLLRRAINSRSNLSGMSVPNRQKVLDQRTSTLKVSSVPPTEFERKQSAANAPLLEDVLKFPKVSTQAYSYARLSANSLALRLNVLKRSLEILSDRPDLVISRSSTSYNEPQSVETKPYSRDGSEERINLRGNASYAALSALFMSNQRSRDTSPNSQNREHYFESRDKDVGSTMDLKQELKPIIALLEKADTDMIHDHEKDVALKLHDLSLSGVTTEKYFKKNLLYALATPFLESSNHTLPIQTAPSSLALSTLPTSIGSSKPRNSHAQRPYHGILSTKNVSPQAVFTCQLDSPWSLKAANDLACLMFGVTRNSIRALALLDLIAPRSRDFVLQKLYKRTSEIVFSGEIIAVVKPNNTMAWTSLWSKRKDDMMILIFDQIPCDSFDLTISKPLAHDTDSEYYIHAFKEHTGSLLEFATFEQGDPLSFFIPSLAMELASLVDRHNESELPINLQDSAHINDIRYYTLRFHDNHIPCAITSIPLDNENESDKESVIRMNIHCLPYIAGTFVVSSSSYKILAHNDAISKNLFGTSNILNLDFDQLIPDFRKLVETAKIRERSLKNSEPNLVLPEHYFRKLKADLAGHSSSEREELFLNGKGLDAIHRDGTRTRVDIQLRVPNAECYILWITYSRTVQFNDLRKDRRHSVVEPLDLHHTLSHSSNEDRSMALPSQLQLLRDHETDLVSCSGDSSDELSRSNSLLRDNPIGRSESFNNIGNRANNYGMKPFSARELEKVNSEPLVTVIPNKIKTESMDGLLPTESSALKYEKDVIAKESHELKVFSEDKLLSIENEEMANIQAKSALWPKQVGLKRREKKITEFIRLKNMGEGAYGKVSLCVNKEDPGYKVIIKSIIKERILVDTWVRDRKLGTIPSEIQIMAFMNHDPHPNIMRIVDFFEDSNYYYLETPAHGDPTGIDLFDLIEIKTNMSEEECKYIYRQCCSAVAHLHKHGVVHRDIKDENIIVDSNSVVKLIDFGSAAYVKNGPFDVFVGTIDYSAPEVLHGAPYEGKPQDVWAMGILLYTLVYKENPFYNVDDIIEGELRLPPVFSNECTDLIKKILVRDVEKRPTMGEIMEHSWLKSKA